MEGLVLYRVLRYRQGFEMAVTSKFGFEMRWSESLKLESDHGRSVNIWNSWLVREYPTDFIQSAEHALSGDSSYDRCFMFVADHVDGRFHAHPTEKDLVELYITVNGKFYLFCYRKTEVEKIIKIVRRYFWVEPIT